ncbi:MAG: response regulator [Elusimicrobia bacterium]|jgi:two-component system KDP operon response regulator KdpE|nr:response regulator [Elusimicrobiota bacterium]
MGKKILIIDDEALVRNYVRRALASRGWAVTEMADGASALDLLGREAFDVVICDLKMPDMRGEEVIKRIRQGWPAVKIIVITGSVSNITSPIVPGVEVDGFLIKPFGIDEIRALADKAIGA